MQEIDAQNPKTAELQRRLSERRPGASKAAPEPARAPAPAKPPAAARVPDIQEGALELEEEPAQEADSDDGEVASGSDALGEVEEEIGSGPQSMIQEMAAEPDEEGEEADDDEFISEHFTEAEVFVKYGLLEKAKEQLLKILDKYPKHVPSHTKLKEIYYEEGDKEKAVAECLSLAAILKGRNRAEEAQDFVNESIRIDPNNPRIKEFMGAPKPAASAAGAARSAPSKPAPAPPPIAEKAAAK